MEEMRRQIQLLHETVNVQQALLEAQRRRNDDDDDDDDDDEALFASNHHDPSKQLRKPADCNSLPTAVSSITPCVA